MRIAALQAKATGLRFPNAASFRELLHKALDCLLITVSCGCIALMILFIIALA